MADENGFSDALKKQQYGLIVVGSKSNDGEPNGMTATWTSQVSFDPQIVAVAIQSGSQTRKNIDETGVFSISILGEGTKDLSLKFTKKSTSGEGRLEGEPVSYYETGTPVLDVPGDRRDRARRSRRLLRPGARRRRPRRRRDDAGRDRDVLRRLTPPVHPPAPPRRTGSSRWPSVRPR